MAPNDPVWPFGPPPVCCAFWDDEAWRVFTEGFRPKGYTGGRTDEKAWKAYLKAKDDAFRKEFYARHGVTA